jgi:hypothetical protein
MWIFLNNAFLSIVEPPRGGSTLLVRARSAGDITNVFPQAKVTKTSKRDYRYRASIDRTRVAIALTKAVMDIDYNNFKDSVVDDDRHDAYLRVWSVMAAEQTRTENQR